MSKIGFYFSLPEMRIFWLFLVLVLAILVIDIIYLDTFWTLITAGIFLVIGSVIFISSLKLARSNFEIKVEKSQAKGIITNLRDGIITYDPDFKILIFNPAAENIFSLKAKDVIGIVFDPSKAQFWPTRLLVQVLFPSLVPQVIRRSLPGQYPQVIDMSFEEPHLELRVTTAKITDPQDRLLGFLKLVQDRTREKDLLKSKAEFITVAAHQLRTPLTGIKWTFEELLKGDLGEINDNQREVATKGIEASQLLIDTVNDLLDVAKIEEAKFGYKFTKINLVESVEQSLIPFQEIAKQRKVNLYFEKPKEEIPLIAADLEKFSLVLQNLFTNAIKYNVENGEVVVSIKKLPDQPFVLISVKDTGIGIPPQDLNHLFSKFFRAGNVLKYEPEGLGLGLYIAKNVIQRHGGRIWAESELNRGSIFYFTLPTDEKLIPPKEVFYEEE